MYHLPAMKLFVLCVLAVLTYLASFEAAIVKQTWIVEYSYRSPDCYKRLVMTINGLSPGPTIEAVQGDQVVVEVKNNLLGENIAIHWHGIKQIGTPWFDGTQGVTQCGIQPKDTFVYKFVVDKSGTYMYHAHYGMQMGEGLYGMIIVRAPTGVSEPFDYQEDHHILLNDWYHKNSQEQATDLSSMPIVWIGEPDSILIHGRGKFNCNQPGIEAGLCNATNPQCSPYTLTVNPQKVIRLRLGSLTSKSSLSFEIEGHNMTIVEADGHYVEPFTVNNLYIYSGETYSVLIHTNQNHSRNYWMVAKVFVQEMDSDDDNVPIGLAILNYAPNPPSTTAPPSGPNRSNTSVKIQQSLAIKGHHDYIISPPKKSDREFFFLNSVKVIEGRLRWCVNNVSLNLPSTPHLISLKRNTSDQTPIARDGMYRLQFKTIVDVIITNAGTLSGQDNGDTHPWHLHGHDVWVLGYGIGVFDRIRDTQKFNLFNPIMKNTVPLHPSGWIALRFVADNPGVWAFHCHIEGDLFMGMGVIFETGIDRVGELPKSIMGCGDTKGLG